MITIRMPLAGALGIVLIFGTISLDAGNEKTRQTQAEINWYMGLDQLHRGDLREAVVSLSAFLQAQPREAKGYLARGNAYVGIQSYPDALNDFNQAALLDPASMEPYIGRALVYLAMGRDQRRRWTELNERVRINPTDFSAGSERASAMKDMEGCLAQAWSNCDRAIQMDNTKAKTYVLRGEIRMEQSYINLSSNQRGYAIEDFNRALELDPKLTDAYFRRGICLMVANRSEEALRDFKETLRQEPNHAGAYFHSGECYEKLYQEEEAGQAYLRCLRLITKMNEPELFDEIEKRLNRLKQRIPSKRMDVEL
ncbi:MAG: tetratricopeptide repeat protein [candidate division FCPU426 bacterium]